MSNSLEDILETLIVRPTGETDFVDYKSNLNWNNDIQKAELIKNIAAFTNSKGGYLIYGVEDKKLTLKGLSEEQIKLFDQTDFSSFLKKYLSPIPKMRVHRYSHDNKMFGVIEVHSFELTPSIVTTAFAGLIFPGDVFIRTPQATTEKISTEHEMRKLLDRCLLRKKEEIREILLSALPKEEVKKEPLFEIMTSRVFTRIQDEWSQWGSSLQKGRLQMAIPKEKLKMDLVSIEKAVHDSIIEYRDYAIPWYKESKLLRQDRDRSNYTWPLKQDTWIRDFPGIYASVDKAGRISYYVSYWEDSPTRSNKGSEKHFSFFTTLQSNLLFLAFLQKFMKRLGQRSFEVRFFANDTKDRKLFMDDPKRTPFFRDYLCHTDKVISDIEFSEGDSILEKTVEWSREILIHFQVQEDLLGRLKGLLENYCADFFHRTDFFRKS